MSGQQYMRPVAYFERTPAEVRQLQKEAGDLREEVDDARTSWVDRTRSAERLKTVERELQSSRMAHRQAEQQQVQQSAPASPCSPQMVQNHGAPPGYIRSDNGEAYLWVGNAAAAQQQQLYAEPVGY